VRRDVARLVQIEVFIVARIGRAAAQDARVGILDIGQPVVPVIEIGGLVAIGVGLALLLAVVAVDEGVVGPLPGSVVGLGDRGEMAGGVILGFRNIAPVPSFLTFQRSFTRLVSDIELKVSPMTMYSTDPVPYNLWSAALYSIFLYVPSNGDSP
jgi:hypothetical protein